MAKSARSRGYYGEVGSLAMTENIFVMSLRGTTVMKQSTICCNIFLLDTQCVAFYIPVKKSEDDHVLVRYRY
jgi:hypothetical protein